MVSQLYQYLTGIGYHHPLHPALAHLPVGLTLAAALFVLTSFVRRRQDYAQTARHCGVLALLMAVPTIAAGYFDWQHFYGGAVLFAIRAKIALAAALVVLLVAAWSVGRRRGAVKVSRVFVHILGAATVAALGFFGGELVYGKKAVAQPHQPTQAAQPSIEQPSIEQPVNTASVAAGESIFKQSCGFCHYSDSTETKVGPGLKELFQREEMAVSGWPVTPENVRKQMMTPFEQMPAFESLTDAEITALMDYLKSL